MQTQLNQSRSSIQDADDSDQRDCDLPILSWMAIPDSYEHGNDDGEK